MRQHSAPILVPTAGAAEALRRVEGGWSEDAVQALIHHHPASLPIRDIDPIFADPVPLCRDYVDIYLDAPPAEREVAIAWVRDRLRAFVAVFRPRVRAIVQSIEEG